MHRKIREKIEITWADAFLGTPEYYEAMELNLGLELLIDAQRKDDYVQDMG